MRVRYKKANVTHPTLNVTVQLPILAVKKNPSNPLYTQLGVLTKGTMYVRSIYPSPPGGPFLTMLQHRSQRLRPRYCHGLGQDCLGSLRPDHKQPRGKKSSWQHALILALTCPSTTERWLLERCSPGIDVAWFLEIYGWGFARLAKVGMGTASGVGKMVEPDIIIQCDIFGTICVLCQCRSGSVARDSFGPRRISRRPLTLHIPRARRRRE